MRVRMRMWRMRRGEWQEGYDEDGAPVPRIRKLKLDLGWQHRDVSPTNPEALFRRRSRPRGPFPCPYLVVDADSAALPNTGRVTTARFPPPMYLGHILAKISLQASLLLLPGRLFLLQPLPQLLLCPPSHNLHLGRDQASQTDAYRLPCWFNRAAAGYPIRVSHEASDIEKAKMKASTSRKGQRKRK